MTNDAAGPPLPDQRQALEVNGWTILVHPLFIEQVTALIEEVALRRRKDPAGYKGKNCTKRLAAIIDLAFRDISQDPTRTAYAQGSTLGNDYRHWFRAKFFQQYRLFFRYDLASRIIIYGWVNDERTKRAYGSKTDAYAVFRDMLESGHPPDDMAALKAACEDDAKRRHKTGEPSFQDIVMGARQQVE
jgi:toxin YhaV